MMSRLPTLFFLCTLTFLVAFGFTIGLQGVFGIHIPGINIGRVLNLGEHQITHVGPPTATGDVATKGFVDSVAATLQKDITGACPAGQGIRAIADTGTLSCLPVGGTLQTAFTMTFPVSVSRFWTATPWSDIGLSFSIPADAKEWQCTVAGGRAPAFDSYIDPFDLRLVCNGAEVWDSNISHNDTSYKQIGKFTTNSLSCSFQGRFSPFNSGCVGCQSHLHEFGGACYYAK